MNAETCSLAQLCPWLCAVIAIYRRWEMVSIFERRCTGRLPSKPLLLSRHHTVRHIQNFRHLSFRLFKFQHYYNYSFQKPVLLAFLSHNSPFLIIWLTVWNMKCTESGFCLCSEWVRFILIVKSRVVLHMLCNVLHIIHVFLSSKNSPQVIFNNFTKMY